MMLTDPDAPALIMIAPTPDDPIPTSRSTPATTEIPREPPTVMESSVGIDVRLTSPVLDE
jgi:hypothetical protein